MSIILRFGQGVLHRGPLEDGLHVGVILTTDLWGISQGGFQEDLRLEALGLPWAILRVAEDFASQLVSTVGLRPDLSRLF